MMDKETLGLVLLAMIAGEANTFAKGEAFVAGKLKSTRPSRLPTAIVGRAEHAMPDGTVRRERILANGTREPE